MQRIFLLICIAFTAAISGALSKFVLHEISVESLMFLRFLVAFIFMLPFYKLLKWKTRSDIAYLLLISSGMGLSSIFYIYWIKTTNLGASQAIFMTLPIATLFLSYIILHEKIRIQKFIGIIISMLWAGIVFFLPKIYSNTELNIWTLSGNAFIVLGAFSYATYLVFAKKTKFTSMEFMYGWVLSATIIGTVLWLSDMLTKPNPYANLSILGMLSIIWIGAIWTVGLYFLVQKLMKLTSPLFLSFWNYIQLIFSTLLWFFFFDEYIGVGFIIGSMLTMYGVYYISKIKS